jgi:ubiquinone/menaquinone biosynthesis C-methylase UbiE
MPTITTPFTDPQAIAALYAGTDRLHRRTAALHRAKVIGADATATIAALATAAQPHPARIIDVGCGRGSLALRLAQQYPETGLTCIDQSPALLHVVRDRLGRFGHSAEYIAADFHRLPVPTHHADLAAAAFCLYHSSHPATALAEIARCVRPGGHLIMTTKSTDSYAAIHTLIARAGIDRDATQRPSLYQTFHRDNADGVVRAAGLVTVKRLDQEHTFRFLNFGHLGEYVATCPQYQLPPALARDPQRLSAVLTERVPDTPVTTTSTVTYLLVQRP